MNKFFALTLLGYLFFLQKGFAQAPNLKAGLNISTISTPSSLKNEFKPGFYLGIGMFKTLRKKNLIKGELVYSQQGAKLNSKETASYNYLNMPILFSHGIGKRIYFDFGPQVGIILSGILRGDDKVDVTAKLRTLDISLASGFTYSLSKAIKLESRVNYGLINTLRDPYPETFRNIFFQAGFQIYFIKEKEDK